MKEGISGGGNMREGSMSKVREGLGSKRISAGRTMMEGCGCGCGRKVMRGEKHQWH